MNIIKNYNDFKFYNLTKENELIEYIKNNEYFNNKTKQFLLSSIDDKMYQIVKNPTKKLDNLKVFYCQIESIKNFYIYNFKVAYGIIIRTNIYKATLPCDYAIYSHAFNLNKDNKVYDSTENGEFKNVIYIYKELTKEQTIYFYKTVQLDKYNIPYSNDEFLNFMRKNINIST